MPDSLCQLDDFDLPAFTRLAAGFGSDRYGFVVTPNADHLIRLHDDPQFRTLYGHADFVLLDSRFLAHVLRITHGLRLPVCPGSDLTEALFGHVIRRDDKVVLVGGSSEQAQAIATRYGLGGLAHFNPPMGFIRDPAAVEQCLRFVEANSPFRFCFLAVGAPQQEVIARQLKERGRARGLALCVGASLNFLTGEERRAPLWMQRIGLEWLFRLLQDPGRMARRYLVRGPRVFGLLLANPLELRVPWHRIDAHVAGRALRAVIQRKRPSAGQAIGLDEIRGAWSRTGLRQSDLVEALRVLRKDRLIDLGDAELAAATVVVRSMPAPAANPEANAAADGDERLLMRARARRRSGPCASERRAPTTVRAPHTRSVG